MTTNEKIRVLKNENKLLEAKIRDTSITYVERGNCGRQIIKNNKAIKELKKELKNHDAENISRTA